MRNHLGDRQHLQIAAGVIVVLMGVDDIAQRLIRHRLDLRKDVGVVAIEHVVNEDDTLRCRVEGDVAAFA